MPAFININRPECTKKPLYSNKKNNEYQYYTHYHYGLAIDKDDKGNRKTPGPDLKKYRW